MGWRGWIVARENNGKGKYNSGAEWWNAFSPCRCSTTVSYSVLVRAFRGMIRPARAANSPGRSFSDLPGDFLRIIQSRAYGISKANLRIPWGWWGRDASSSADEWKLLTRNRSPPEAMNWNSESPFLCPCLCPSLYPRVRVHQGCCIRGERGYESKIAGLEGWKKGAICEGYKGDINLKMIALDRRVERWIPESWNG